MSENSAVNQTLRHYAAMAKRPIYIAWGLSVVSTLILILQSWLIAVIFADWLTQITHHRPATDVFFNYLPWLMGCLLLRPLLHFCKDQLALEAGLQVASILRKTLLEKLAQVGAARDQYGSDGGLASMVIEQCDALTGYVSRF